MSGWRDNAVLRTLSSGWLTTWLLTGWLVYYVSLAVWQTEAFSSFAAGMARNRLLQGLFVLLLVNVFLRMSRFFGGWKHRPLWTTFVSGLLLAGAALLLLGFFLSLTGKQAIRPLVGEGDVLGTEWSQEIFPVERILVSLSPSYLDLPEAGSGLFVHEPRMTVRQGDRVVEVGAFPPTRLGRTWMHILQCGFAPGMQITQGGNVVWSGHTPMRVLPPGVVDSFEIEGSPYRLLLRLKPQRTIHKGNLEAGVYDLEKPVFEIRILKAGEEIARGDSESDIDFDGYRLENLPSTPWVLLDVVRDDGILLVAAGLLAMTLGAILMPVERIWSWLRSQKIGGHSGDG